jgi:non-specific serine/threonine protein kinase/serine/threonine-protein kinase
MTEESLFELAVNTPEAERPAVLDRACGGDAALRARLEALLSAHLAVGGWLDLPHGAVRTRPDRPAPPAAGAGAVVAGRYKLLQQIGEGGMGAVWMADQTEPVKRRVAVKLIRAERGDSGVILARFDAERQAIALMNHPHIAKLMDAGTAEGGAPFFVMELVKGVPLTQFCDRERLSVPERLRLFLQVCSAVQHAHQKGVIHRDLKPTNILVESHDGRPVPKVIDFGLAKATNGLSLTERTVFTAFGSVMGTPLYMAPEQATFNAVDVDTRADIYSLGVILYELLTGTTPLLPDSVKKAGFDEVLRLVREQEAPPPSSRVSKSEARPALAASRQTEAERLGRLVKGELDWIVLKALSKERERRYETASALARDIERFLNHDPVSAGPPTAAYRLRKFVRRNRGQVIAAGLVLLALVTGIIGTTWGLVRATRAAESERQAKQDADAKRVEAESATAREKAARLEERRQRRFAQAIADFVVSDFLALTSVEGQDRFGGEGLDRNATLFDLLERAAGKLKARKDLDPLIEAELCWIVGVNYRGAGEAAKAVPFLVAVHGVQAEQAVRL